MILSLILSISSTNPNPVKEIAQTPKITRPTQTVSIHQSITIAPLLVNQTPFLWEFP